MKSKSKEHLIVGLAIALAAIAILAYLYSSNMLPLSLYYGSANITIYNGSHAALEQVWIAGTPKQQAEGMMNRMDFGGKYGMLFVFNSQQPLCFWMKDTEIPLKQIWINQSNHVTDIYSAQPYNTSSVCAYGTYVLEIPINESVGVGYSINISK